MHDIIYNYSLIFFSLSFLQVNSGCKCCCSFCAEICEICVMVCEIDCDDYWILEVSVSCTCIIMAWQIMLFYYSFWLFCLLFQFACMVYPLFQFKDINLFVAALPDLALFPASLSLYSYSTLQHFVLLKKSAGTEAIAWGSIYTESAWTLVPKEKILFHACLVHVAIYSC